VVDAEVAAVVAAAVAVVVSMCNNPNSSMCTVRFTPNGLPYSDILSL